jgi:sigma-B regulation protein RsbU (phosphoserine phosphatase)
MARILLVEDDPATREVVEAILRFDAHELLLAGNATQARVLLQERRPEIVLSDIRMPGASGTDFCREVRRNPELNDTYFILYTGFDSPDQRTEALASGADDYLGKPLRADDLHARIRLGLRIRGMHRESRDLRGRASEAGKLRIEMESSMAKIRSLRAEMAESLQGLEAQARLLRDACLQGDGKRSMKLSAEVAEKIEALRARLAPREGP